MPSEIGFNPSGSKLQLKAQQDISSLDPKLSRSNYFDGRLLRASDLTRDQLYLDERLREVGRAIGSGIVRGLNVRLAGSDELSITPGLAVAPSGRVLELSGERLSIRLQDAAAIASLNPDRPQRLSRGLYAVALQLLEIGTDSAEVYPRDLEGQRGFHFNAWSEGVELVLVPLRNALPNATASEKSPLGRQHALGARSALVREFIANDGQPADLPEDAVALALLAIEHGRVLWLDRGLVRRPHRHPHAEHVLQADLHRHYQELLNDVLQWRIERNLYREFPASHYFRVLPPYGNLPKTTLDPEAGRQAWFPSGYEVSIAPVREDDLPAILAESAALDPIDLEKDDDVDVMVLVPMSDHQFAWRARQLQHREEGVGSEAHTALPHLDRLALRLYQAVEEPVDKTDAAIWRAIWNDTDQPIYVRRPPRVAETLVSGVVLAAGYEPAPSPVKGIPPDVEDMEQQIVALQDERDALLRAIKRKEAEVKLLEDSQDKTDDERLALARQEIASLQQQLEKLSVDEQQLKKLQQQYDKQLITIEKLQQEIAQLQEGATDTGGGTDTDTTLLKAQIQSLQKQLGDADEQIAQLKLQLQNAGTGPALPSIGQLAELRGADAAAKADAARLAEVVADDAQRLLAVQQLAQLIGPRYDKLFYTTLGILAERKNLLQLREILPEMLASGASIGEVMLEMLPGLGTSLDLAKQWAELEESFNPGAGDQATIEQQQATIKDLQDQLAQARASISSLQLQLASAGDTGELENRVKQLQQQLEAANKTIVELGGSEPFSVDFNKVEPIPIEQLWKERAPAMKNHPEFDEIEVAAEQVITRANSNEIRLARATQMLTITPPRYDPALWRCMYAMLGRNNGTDFRNYLYQARVAGVDLGLAVAASTDQGLAPLQKDYWFQIDLPS